MLDDWFAGKARGAHQKRMRMARARQFDEETALDAATEHFWRHGYEATSVRDLAQAMGITGASLYNAFGDKRGLYRRALDRYIVSTFGERSGRFRALPPRPAIEFFFAEIIDSAVGDAQRKGCMVINAALELAPHDLEFREVVADVLAQIEAFFRHCVSAGQDDGSISRAQPAADLAKHLLGILVGVQVLARARPQRELLEGLVRPTLALLEMPAAA